MFYKKMDLQLFEDGAGAAPGNQGGNAGGNNNGAQGSTGAAYSFEQAEEIANARAQRAEQAALRSYFQQQGHDTGRSHTGSYPVQAAAGGAEAKCQPD